MWVSPACRLNSSHRRLARCRIATSSGSLARYISPASMSSSSVRSGMHPWYLGPIVLFADGTPACPHARSHLPTRAIAAGIVASLFTAFLHLEKAARVTVEHLLFILDRKRHRLRPLHAGWVLHERVVDGEPYVVDADLEQGAEQSRRREVAAAGHVEVL